MNLKSLICYHRGVSKIGDIPNSYEAIKNAIQKKPLLVEFDIFLHKGELYTGHPPHDPINKFKDVIKLFVGKSTFPKIDIKVKKDYVTPIKKVLEELKNENIKFALINIGGIKGKLSMEAEEYLASHSGSNVMINIDLARYGKEEFAKHLKRIQNKVLSISPEINESDWEYVFKIAKKYDIPVCNFWLRGWPDVKNPSISERKILEAFLAGRKQGLIVLFDLNPFFVTRA